MKTLSFNPIGNLSNQLKSTERNGTLTSKEVKALQSIAEQAGVSILEEQGGVKASIQLEGVHVPTVKFLGGSFEDAKGVLMTFIKGLPKSS